MRGLRFWSSHYRGFDLWQKNYSRNRSILPSVCKKLLVPCIKASRQELLLVGDELEKCLHFLLTERNSVCPGLTLPRNRSRIL